MNFATQAVASASFKPIGIMLEGSPLALLGIRPTYDMVQIAGTPNPLSPRDRAMMDMGFTALARNYSADFTPHPAWTISLSPDGNYAARYEADGTQFSGGRPAPPQWLDIVRTTSRCLLIWQFACGEEIISAELLDDMEAGNVLAVGARYTGN